MIFFRNIATLGFIGYIPCAPGTFGSLIAFILFILIKPSIFVHMMMLLFLIPVGVISSHYAEILLKDKDSSHIVIDEFCGYFIAVLFLPHSAFYILGAFFLFRFFDILKPFPIRTVEHLFPGGAGVMADDIVAALYTNVILQVVRLMWYS
jgi:phosphatidylglycerophosphatase A